ncbi:YciI family protein [Nakamurella lactea]|jgi:hypothetical protein|uniref:YciI family protein n=1 Tax=Nakamurella lactea TaxID=459515 RepID=UPI0004148675|nr:YciI family protein [Nakamurella lactea]
MAQYAVLLYANDSADFAHPTDESDAHQRHAEELERSGALRAAYALTPRALATSVHGDTVTDGPFLDTKEIVAGFYLLDAPDLDAALALARRNPVCQQGGGVEVRPVAGGGPVATAG